MATFVDHVLAPTVHRNWTRAERIEDARHRLANEKASKRIDRGSVTYRRRELTREVFYLRVEKGEPLACRRWQWIQRVRDFRQKIDGPLGLRYHVGRLVAYLEADRERLGSGVRAKGRNKGKPYSAVTVRNLQRNIARYECELAEAEPQIAAFLATAPPPYHAWRREQEDLPTREPQRQPDNGRSPVESIPMLEPVAALIPQFRRAFEAAWNTLEEPTSALTDVVFGVYADTVVDGSAAITQSRLARLPHIARWVINLEEAALELEKALWPDNKGGGPSAGTDTLDPAGWHRLTLELIQALQARVARLPQILAASKPNQAGEEDWLRRQLDGLKGEPS